MYHFSEKEQRICIRLTEGYVTHSRVRAILSGLPPHTVHLAPSTAASAGLTQAVTRLCHTSSGSDPARVPFLLPTFLSPSLPTPTHFFFFSHSGGLNMI